MRRYATRSARDPPRHESIILTPEVLAAFGVEYQPKLKFDMTMQDLSFAVRRMNEEQGRYSGGPLLDTTTIDIWPIRTVYGSQRLFDYLANLHAKGDLYGPDPAIVSPPALKYYASVRVNLQRARPDVADFLEKVLCGY